MLVELGWIVLESNAWDIEHTLSYFYRPEPGPADDGA